MWITRAQRNLSTVHHPLLCGTSPPNGGGIVRYITPPTDNRPLAFPLSSLPVDTGGMQ